MTSRAVPWRHARNVVERSPLAFLYCTRTIQRNFTTKTDRSFHRTQHEAQSDDGHPSPPGRERYELDHVEGNHDQPKFRKTATRHGTQKARPNNRDGRFDSRSEQRTDHVPFEGPVKQDRREDVEFENSTITPSERKAFEGLFKLKRDRVDAQRSQREEAEQNTRGTETEPTGNRGMDMDMDSILDNAMESLREDEDRGTRRELPSALKPMAAAARSRRGPAAQPKAQDDDYAKEIPSSDTASAEISRIMKALTKATTDAKLWDLIHTHVFSRVSALNLDGTPTPRKRRNNNNNDDDNTPTPSHEATLQLLTAVLPPLLPKIHTLLTHRFPTSPLALNLLPTLKSLGPSAAALGLSTELYNRHLRALHTHAFDQAAMLEVLAEMEREVYAFDERTEDAVGKVLADAKRGGWIWGLEGRRAVVRGLFAWSKVMAERRGEEGMRRAREGAGA